VSAPAPSNPSQASQGTSPSKPRPLDVQDQYAKSLEKLAQVRQSIEDFKSSESKKEIRKKVKLELRKPITSCSASWSSIEANAKRVFHVMDDSCKDVASRNFAEFTLAEILVGQAQPQFQPWPMAQVACRIFERFPNVQEILRGMLCEKCPQLTANFQNQPTQSAEEFDEHVNNTVAIHRFALAIAVTQGELGSIWHWLSRALNQKPTAITVVMVHAALDAAGQDAQERYKKQFDKLVAYVEKEFMAEVLDLISNIRGQVGYDHVQARQTQLQKWLQDFKQSGKAQAPAGRHITAVQETSLNPYV